MSEAGYVTTGETPLTRTLAAVLRDEFSGTDDAVRLVLATTVSANTGHGSGAYICISIAGGPTLVVPSCINLGDNLGNTYGGYLVYCLATRTHLLALARPANQGA